MHSLKKCAAVSMLALAATACATTGRVELKSEPGGAEVSNLAGEKLGQTPLSLKDDALAKAVRDGRFAVVLSSPGYADREVLMELHGDDTHTVRLRPLDESYFSQRLLNDFSRESNAMARELLQIQGLLIVKKLDEAEKRLTEFQKRFPNIAASYVLLGNIESARGNAQKARGYLARARQIDPADPVIARLLGVEPAREPASDQGAR